MTEHLLPNRETALARVEMREATGPYQIGGIDVAAAYDALSVYLQSFATQGDPAMVIEQINELTKRRRNGVWKTPAEVRRNLFGKDPVGDITGREKPGEFGELLRALQLWAHVMNIAELLKDQSNQLDTSFIDLPKILQQMEDEADADVMLQLDATEPLEEQIIVAIKAMVKIADEVADLVLFAHYLRDEALLTLLMNKAQALTGWNTAQLRQIAAIKYFVRNQFSDRIKKESKKVDKKNRKAIEQVLLTKYFCAHPALLKNYRIDTLVIPELELLQREYRLEEKRQLQEVPHAAVVISDLAGTLLNTPALFTEAYRRLAALKETAVWTAEEQEELEIRVRAARMTDPLASRQAEFLKMMGVPSPTSKAIAGLKHELAEILAAVFSDSEIAFQPGVEKFLEYQTTDGRKLLAFTGIEQNLLAIIQAKVPQLQKMTIYTRLPLESDSDIVVRILQENKLQPEDCTGIFDAATHVRGALDAGLAGGNFPVFYIPSITRIEAQALSLGHTEKEGARKVYEAETMEDLLQAWSVH